MHFDSWQAFWEMGDYGLFVWLAFGVSLLALLVLCIDTLLAKRGLFAKVQSEVARKQRIQQAQIAQKASQKAAQQSASQRSTDMEVERVNES
jgi:heme exporter protein D